MSVFENRKLVRQILDDRSPADAPTAYYALHYPPAKTVLTVGEDERTQRMGFVAACQTGLDLFRPLVTMRCFSPQIAGRLLEDVLNEDRPYLFFARRDQLPLAETFMEVEYSRLLHVFQLDPDRFKPVVNVMVQHHTAPDGMPRCEIFSGGLQARAGVNWSSERFAEVFVHVEPEARQRGWGRSVASACTDHLLRIGKTPLYLVDIENEASRELALNVGYVDTGARQVYAEVVYTGG
jgi:RimJ/RimL family protein N-acetyltransferase